jgi:NADH-quinone oxidoreductase subunit L
MLGALLTSLYIYRLIFLVFYGSQRTHVAQKTGPAMSVSMIVLCVLSLVGGFVDTPPHFGGVPALSNFLNSTLPELKEVHIGPITELATALCASLVFATGLVLAYSLYYWRHAERPAHSAVSKLMLSGFGFDAVYNALFVQPYNWLARAAHGDTVDDVYSGLALLIQACHRALRLTETGRVRWYASGLAIGSALFILFILIAR